MNLINQIYNQTYSPLLTPYNLIETLKLDNYISLNMEKNSYGIVSKIRCVIDERPINFYYQFDKNDHLLTIYYYENRKITYLFNRNENITSLKSEFKRVKTAI